MSSMSKKDLSDPISKKEKIEYIRAQAKMFEEQAHRKEVAMKYNRASVDDVVDANEMLLGAIDSKLEVLEGIVL
jgi:hypothetical protein